MAEKSVDCGGDTGSAVDTGEAEVDTGEAEVARRRADSIR